MEIINVGVGAFVSWVAGHGERSFLMVTIFSLRRKIICCVWEVGTQCWRKKKKRHLLPSLGKVKELINNC